MLDWTSGYVADIGYTYGYYTELNPQRIQLAFLNAGLVAPQVGTACELGFGQGLSANLHAAASVVHWSGTDFNPAQASFAQELSRVAASDAALFDEAFEDFCCRDDLPEFDYIGLHGIWSWVSDENRRVIVDFIRRKLKVGGVLYISYNTQPGWAAMVPMRDLLTEHAEVLGADGAGILNRVDSALTFAEQLLAANPLYARANPQIVDRIKRIKAQDRHYVAHEYFNLDWEPMAFAKMAQWLAPAKVQWACSANYIDAIDAVNLSTEQRQLLSSIPDPMFRQTTRDFCVNQSFRKDYWVKGARTLTLLEQAEMLRKQRVVLAQPRADVSLKVQGNLGEATMQESVYGPVLDLLADHQPRSLEQMEAQLKAQGVSFGQIMEVVMVLVGTGVLFSVQDDAAIAKAKGCAQRLNRYLLDKSRSSKDLNFLACPVTGGGMLVPRLEQMFLLALQAGKQQPRELAAFAWSLFELQGQRIIKDGRKLETEQEHLEELAPQAQAFVEKRLPMLKALQII